MHQILQEGIAGGNTTPYVAGSPLFLCIYDYRKLLGYMEG